MTILMGLMRLGRDAELKKTAADSVCNLALAYNYGQKGSDGKKPSQWVDAALWGKRAEALAEHLKKGTSVVVTLIDVHVRTFQKNDGTAGSALSGRVLDIEFAGRPTESAAPKPPPPKPAPPPQQEGAFVDDDIPF